MKKPFETYIAFIENELGVKLLNWQRIALEGIYNGYCPYISSVRGGKVIMERAAEMLTKEINRDTGNLPPRLYELDGYKADILLCDDIARYNIEKENKDERMD